MPSYTDRLEKNLKSKVDVLDKIYESDQRFIERFDSSSPEFEQYDEYMDEQDAYLAELNELDSEYDEIYAYLSMHQTETSIITPKQKQSIAILIRKTDGRIQAIDSIETKIKKMSEIFFRNRRDDIAMSRRATRVIRKNYRMIPQAVTEENRIFDSSN